MQKVSILKKLIPLLIASLFFGGGFFYKQCCDGFSLEEITSVLPPDLQKTSLPLNEDEKAYFQQFFSQPFYYLGKGIQSYAFESADHKYVLKFFKHKHLTPLDWLRKIPFLSSRWVEGKINKRECRINRLFSSCELAYAKLPQETALMLYHLNTSPFLNCNLTIYNKMGVKERIDLDKFEYVLQKKAAHVDVTVQALVRENDEAKIRDNIRQIVDLIVSRCEKGIKDHDKAFVYNIGFLPDEHRAIFIDFGMFGEDELMTSKEEQKAEITRRLKLLQEWSAKQFPSFASCVEQEITTLCP